MFGPDGHGTLEFWNVSKTGLSKGDQWSPYEGAGGSNGGDRGVRWAAYLGPSGSRRSASRGIW